MSRSGTCQLFLHVGITKTGSTSIQVALERYREELGSNNIYVQNKEGVSHSLLPAAFVGDLTSVPTSEHPMWMGKSPRQALDDFMTQFDQELGRLNPMFRACVISSEHITDWLTRQDQVTNLLSMLKQYFSDIKVVVYLRSQDKHLASNYNEHVKSGESTNPEDLISPANHPVTYDYLALIQRFSNYLGPDSIIPRIYERSSLYGGEAVADFFHVIGCHPLDLAQLRYNPGACKMGQELLIRARKLLDTSPGHKGWRNSVQWYRLVESVLETLPGKGWQPSSIQSNEIMKPYHEGNAAVREMYFPDRTTLFNEDDESIETAVPPSSFAEAALRVLLHTSGLLTTPVADNPLIGS